MSYIERHDRTDHTWMDYWFEKMPEIQAIEFDIDDNGYYTDLTFYWVGSNEPWSYRELLPDSRLRLALEGLLDG